MVRPDEDTYIFNSREHFISCLRENNGLIIIKLGATWCGPCVAIKDEVNKQFHRFDEKTICINMDIDESKDVYSALKSKRVFNGKIPTIMCWCKGNTEYFPDDICQGSNINDITSFFNRCLEYIKDMQD
jgi:thiol-disulfide isomerase/thioredoxin